ncbi:hypothetical protein CTI12_AA097220 [Artemisia annua]|uniref:CCHC-type domain-containing protein n=1 Tax=Artemisia annua TaxID=35608 RepID=A0A2U1PKR7_ARTAN|nr:hypothetical protein CTI12_AA097220 [Artemisia annua]
MAVTMEGTCCFTEASCLFNPNIVSFHALYIGSVNFILNTIPEPLVYFVTTYICYFTLLHISILSSVKTLQNLRLRNMVNTNTFLEDSWSNHKYVGDPSHTWHQSKSGRPLRNKMQQNFIHRQLKRENEKKLGKCIRQITNDCKDMLKKKLEEIDAYNSTLTQNKYRKHKCFICKKKGHISTSCPMKHEEENKAENKAETSTQNTHQTDINCTQKPTIELKYRENKVCRPENGLLKPRLGQRPTDAYGTMS